MNHTRPSTAFGPHVLTLDTAAEAQRIEAFIREAVGKRLRCKGAVVAVSGGIDSAVCVTLAARALGKDKVFALLLPERDSSPQSTTLGRKICEGLGVTYIREDIAPALEAMGCYRWRDEAIRRMVPEFGPGWKSKIAVSGGALNHDRVNYFTLTVQSPDGKQRVERMPVDVYLAVVAATNMKQRTRKLMEYSHADRLHYAVIGTPNLLEFQLGFFVRGGDGLADVKPISHLYKTQVYALAREIGVPADVLAQVPSTDTYSLPQTQEEFYFALPYDKMDLMLYAYSSGMTAADVAPAVGLTAEQGERIYRDIVAKIRISNQLAQHALTVGTSGGVMHT